MRSLLMTAAFVVSSQVTIVLAEETEVSFAYVPAPNAESVSIEHPLGKLKLAAWDKPQVRIVARKRAPDAATLDKLRVNVEMRDGAIYIRTGVRVGGAWRPLPPSARGAGIDLTVDAPRRVQLSASTWSGDLEASGFRSGAQLASTGGEVRASDIEGRVTSSSVKGKQRLSSIRGDVAADGVTGDVELDSVDADVLEAKVVEGQITARQVHANLVRLFSTVGGVVFVGSLRAGARYELRAEEGDVRVTLARRGFSVRALAPAGQVRSGFPVAGEVRPTLLRGEYLDGGPTLELAAARGNVLIDPLK